MCYYTYAYLREDGTPYYIGKGKGRRAYKLSGRRVKPPEDKGRILILKQDLTEEEAFRHEIYMIDVFGRKDLGTGILRNLTSGGEGSSGFSDEARRKKSEAQKGKIFSDETKRKLSEARKRRIFSDETRRKLSEAGKGRIPSDETRRKLSEAGKGRIFSDETRRKISEAKKRYYANRLELSAATMESNG